MIKNVDIDFIDDGTVSYRIYMKDKKDKKNGLVCVEPKTGTAKSFGEIGKVLKRLNSGKELKEFFGL